MSTPSLLGSFALVVSIGIVLGVLSSVVSHFGWPLLERWTSTSNPRWRVRIYSAVAAAPVLIPTTFLLLCLAPGVVGHWTSYEDHCASHPDHPHLCLIHPSIALSPLLALGLFFFIVGVAASTLFAARWLLDARRERRFLNGESSRACAPDVCVVRSGEIFALTGGIIRPQIWISSALDEVLTPSEREVVLAHERAHVARRDPLRSLVTRILSGLHGPATRRAILDALRLASEQDCDACAARVVDDRLRVAETLVRVEGLMHQSASRLSFATVSSGVTGSHVPDRVLRLLGEEAPEPGELHTSPLLVVAIVVYLLSMKPLHHLAEHVIASLFRLF